MHTTISYAKVYESPKYAKDIKQDHMLEQNKIITDGDADREQSIQGIDVSLSTEGICLNSV